MFGRRPISTYNNGGLGKGGRSIASAVEPAVAPDVGPALPASQPSENLPINVIGELPMSIDTTSTGTGGGKGGAPMPAVPSPAPAVPVSTGPEMMLYQQPTAQPSMFNNTGRLVDSTLLMQQAILGRQPQQRYQPLITPESYQNFYSMPSTSYGSNAPVVPDYRPMATQFKQEATDAAAAADTGSGTDTGTSDGLSYDPNGSVNLAPVRVIDVNTGNVVSVDPGGTTASGMPGSYLGVGTVGDDTTGPEYDYGTVDNSGVTVSPVQESNVTGTDLGLLGTIGGDYGPVAPTGLSNAGTNAPTVDYWGQPYGLDLGSGRSSGGYSDNGTGVGVGGGPVGAGGGNAAGGYSYGGW